MNWNKIIKYSIPIILILMISTSCYSFSGSSLNPEIKTAQINNFPNYSALQNPNLSQDFTLALQDRFDQRTKLSLVKDAGDILIEGAIIDYTLTPINVQTGDVAAQNRLTISIKVHYENKKEPNKNFDKTFTDYADFNANQTLDQVQNTLVSEINVRIIDQIFNAIVSNW